MPAAKAQSFGTETVLVILLTIYNDLSSYTLGGIRYLLRSNSFLRRSSIGSNNDSIKASEKVERRSAQAKSSCHSSHDRLASPVGYDNITEKKWSKVNPPTQPNAYLRTPGQSAVELAFG
jgi:hypothetical protein